jgi:hypothetical protein
VAEGGGGENRKVKIIFRIHVITENQFSDIPTNYTGGRGSA